MKNFCPHKGIVFRNYINSIYKELFRKSIHLCTAFIPLLLNHFYWTIEVLLILAVIGFSLSEFLRLKGIEIPIVSSITNVAARKRDEGRFVLGPVTLVIGIVLASLFFDRTNYTIGILALAFGDGLASLFGKLFGYVHIPLTDGKTVVGSLSCFFVIFCSTFFITKNVSVSLIIAVCGMFLEAIPLKDFDNLVIPIALAFVSSFLIP